MTKKYKILFIFSIAAFLASRIFILLNQPEFSVVSHNYIHYAYAWKAGFLPYLRQPYEYGPYTIPLFYLPLILEKLLNQPYFLIYKTLLFVFDIALLTAVLSWLKKAKSGPGQYALSLWFYISAGVFLQSFYFDSYDLVFSGIWFSAVFTVFYLSLKGKSLLSDGLFWLASALKYINFPLFGSYLLLHKNKLSQKILTSVLAFVLIWLIPALKFKKSLLTTFFLHSQRGLQVESLPANIVRFINGFTRTEGFAVNSNAIEIIGPLSERFTYLWNIIFPLGLGLVVLFIWYASWYYKKNHKKVSPNLYIVVTLFYIFSFMALGKILSTPYLIWPIVFLAAYDFKSIKKQTLFYGWYLLVVYLSANPIANTQIYFTNLHTLIGLIRGFSLLGMAFYFGIKLKNIVFIKH